MNFAFSPHSWDLVDNCHYTAIFSEVTLTLLVCDSVVNPSRICALIKKKKDFDSYIGCSYKPVLLCYKSVH